MGGEREILVKFGANKMTDRRRNAGQEEVSKTAGSVGNVTQGVRVTKERSGMNEWSNPKALSVE